MNCSESATVAERRRCPVRFQAWRAAWTLIACLATAQGAAASEAAWRALAEPGTLLIMRHALAPGIGDPPGFELDDCTTQRNLSARGRTQARRLGEEIARRGIDVVQVLSSEWCRCLETARLLDVAPVEALPALNSFYEDRGAERALMTALRRALSERDAGRKILLVSHQVNITALTGEVPSSGEAIVFRFSDSGEIAVIGRIAPPD